MAFQKGAQGQFTVQDSGGTVRDLSAYLKDTSLDIKVDLGDTTTFGATARSKVALLRDGAFKIGGFWDPTATSGPAVVLSGILGAAPRTFVYGPMGSTTGNLRRTGSVICSDYSEKQTVTGLIEFSATLECTGAVTFDTYP